MDEDKEVPIHFDDESRIRVLDPEKFKHTEELAEQCTAFVDSTCNLDESKLSRVKITSLLFHERVYCARVRG